MRLGEGRLAGQLADVANRLRQANRRITELRLGLQASAETGDKVQGPGCLHI